MILPALFFYLFAAVCVASAVMVIVSKNPVHSVLYLILAFVNASGLFVLMGAEFLAMILVVVYVGAVAVLFLFVIMMLDVDFTELRDGVLQYMPIGLVIAGIFQLELLLTVSYWVINPGTTRTITAAIPTNVTNTEALGLVLYTKYIHYFQLAGMVLLVAMIGAIVLTHRERPGTRRQKIAEQVARKGSVVLQQVPVGVGIAELGILRPLPKEEPKPVEHAAELLRNQRLQHVFENEPNVNPRLKALRNVVLLPHMSSATLEGRVDMGEKVIINIKTFADGHKPPDRVIPAML